MNFFRIHFVSLTLISLYLPAFTSLYTCQLAFFILIYHIIHHSFTCLYY